MQRAITMAQGHTQPLLWAQLGTGAVGTIWGVVAAHPQPAQPSLLPLPAQVPVASWRCWDFIWVSAHGGKTTWATEQQAKSGRGQGEQLPGAVLKGLCSATAASTPACLNQ